MKTEPEVTTARNTLIGRIASERSSLTLEQLALLYGMLNGIGWVLEGKHAAIMRDILNGRGIAKNVADSYFGCITHEDESSALKERLKKAEEVINGVAHIPDVMVNDPDGKVLCSIFNEMKQQAREYMGLAQALTEQKPEPIPPHAICLFVDGQQICAVRRNFKNLQESTSGFGFDAGAAIRALQRNEAHNHTIPIATNKDVRP